METPPTPRTKELTYWLSRIIRDTCEDYLREVKYRQNSSKDETDQQLLITIFDAVCYHRAVLYGSSRDDIYR